MDFNLFVLTSFEITTLTTTNCQEPPVVSAATSWLLNKVGANIELPYMARFGVANLVYFDSLLNCFAALISYCCRGCYLSLAFRVCNKITCISCVSFINLAIKCRMKVMSLLAKCPGMTKNQESSLT